MTRYELISNLKNGFLEKSKNYLLKGEIDMAKFYKNCAVTYDKKLKNLTIQEAEFIV